MRVAVSARGPYAESDIDRCFGRAYWYYILDLETNEAIAVDNSDIRNALGNAGQMASELLKDYDIDVLLTGETGPKAHRHLLQSGIAVFHGAVGTVIQTIDLWQSGKLISAGNPNGPGNPFCLSEATETAMYHPPEPKLSLVGFYH